MRAPEEFRSQGVGYGQTFILCGIGEDRGGVNADESTHSGTRKSFGSVGVVGVEVEA